MTIDPAAHPMPSGSRRLRRVLLVGLVALLAVIGYQAPVTASPSQAGAGTIQPAGLYAPKGRPQAAADAPQSLANAATHFFYAEGEVSRGISHPTGAQATLTVHRPALRGDYHSLAELAVSSANRQSIIEVGWAVKPGLFGDTQPRVFVYHWVNGGETCYNGCGFVATNPGLLGSVLPVGGVGDCGLLVLLDGSVGRAAAGLTFGSFGSFDSAGFDTTAQSDRGRPRGHTRHSHPAAP